MAIGYVPIVTSLVGTAAAESLSFVFRWRTKLDVLELDAALSEDHALDSEVTENPVEDGTQVADHVRAKPVVLQIEGLVSDTPISALDRFSDVDAVVRGAFSGRGGRAEAAFAKLVALRDAGEPIQVVTRLKTYPRLVIKSLRFPRDPATGHALRFSATLVEITVAESERVPALLAKHQEVKRGRQPAAPAPEPVEQKGSVLWQGFKALGILPAR